MAAAAASPHRRAAPAPAPAADTSDAEPGGEGATPRPRFQLPRAVVPTHYRLFLLPDADRAKFLGHVVVRLCVRRDCDSVTFNALGLDIHHYELQIGPTAVPVLSCEVDHTSEHVTLRLAHRLLAGTTAVLQLSYTGPICTTDGRGFYACTHADPSEDDRQVRQHFLCTYFEPTETRRLFPCWDEPFFRAVFEIAVVVEEPLQAVSNAPERCSAPLTTTDVPLFEAEDEADPPIPTLAALQRDAEEPDAEPDLCSSSAPPRRLVRFQPTPTMCTYLVALIIGPLHYVEATLPTGVPVRVYVPTVVPAEGGRFVLDLAVKAIVFWERFFDFPFPLPKIDIVGVPDLSALGMENVGCQVFHLDYLVVNEATPLSRRQRIARLVGHEISHQWFGNIVAIEWWSHLWLKEGFARYLEFLFVDHVFPEWDYGMYFLGEIYHTVLLLDMDPTRTHPVERDIQHPREVVKAFDAISYEKGAAIINMLLAYLGPQRTSQAMHAYVRRHCYSNVNATALWRAIQDVAGAEGPDLTAAVQHWLSSTGHPRVDVELSSKEGAMWTYTLTQHDMPPPCLALISSSPPSAPFWIPLRVLEMDPEGRELRTTYLILRETTATYDAPAHCVVKFNHMHRAVCRVNYAADLWPALLRQYGRLCSADRLGLCIDISAFCLDSSCSGVPPTLLLDLLAAVHQTDEHHPMVWSTLAKAVMRLLCRCSTTPWYPQLQLLLRRRHEGVQALCQPRQRHDPATYSVSMLDPGTCSAVLTNLLHLGHAAVRAELAGLCDRLRHQGEVPPCAELLSPVLQAGMLSCEGKEAEEGLVRWLCRAADPSGDGGGVGAAAAGRGLQEGCVHALVLTRHHVPEVAAFLLEGATAPVGVLCDAMQLLLLNPPLWSFLLHKCNDILSGTAGEVDEHMAVPDRARHWLWWLLIYHDYCADPETLLVVRRHAARHLHSYRVPGLLALVAGNVEHLATHSPALQRHLTVALDPN